jgi:hypothetical protein
MDLTIGLDPFLNQNVHSIIQILDYLGNVGEMIGSRMTVFGFVGFYLSEKFYVSTMDNIFGKLKLKTSSLFKPVDILDVRTI